MGRAINETKEELFEEVKDVPYELPEGWRWVKLEDIVEINPESVNPVKDFGERTFTYIDISSVENYTGRITNPKIIVAKKAPSRARRLIKHRDILLSTVRPYLMAHAFVSSEYENQVCSTGFAVLRVKNEKQIYPKYLWFSLFSETLLRQYERLMMGASYPALNNNQVRALVIPLPFKDGEPDFEKQKQIVERIEALFKEIDKAIELRQKAIEETKRLFDSVLDRIFREAEKDKENWKRVRLEDIAEFGIGKTPKRSEKKYWEEGKYHWVSISDMQDKYITNTKEKVSQKAFDEVFKGKLIPKGTLLMSFKLTVGKTAILDIPAFHNEAIVHIYPRDNIYRDFLYWILPALDYSKYLNTAIKGKTLNKDVLKNILIPLPFKNNQPDLEKQKQIANYLDRLHTEIKQLEKLQRIQLEKFRQLKESILNKAFRGELL